MEDKTTKFDIKVFFKSFAKLETWLLLVMCHLVMKITSNIFDIMQLLGKISQESSPKFMFAELIVRAIQIVLTLYLILLLQMRKKDFINFSIFFFVLNVIIESVRLLPSFSLLHSEEAIRSPNIFANIGPIVEYHYERILSSIFILALFTIFIKKSKQAKEIFKEDKNLSPLKEIGIGPFIIALILVLTTVVNFFELAYVIFKNSFTIIVITKAVLSAMKLLISFSLLNLLVKRKKSFINGWFFFLGFGVIQDIVDCFADHFFLSPEKFRETSQGHLVLIILSIIYGIIWAIYAKKSKKLKEALIN